VCDSAGPELMRSARSGAIAQGINWCFGTNRYGGCMTTSHDERRRKSAHDTSRLACSLMRLGREERERNTHRGERSLLEGGMRCEGESISLSGMEIKQRLIRRVGVQIPEGYRFAPAPKPQPGAV